MNSNAKPPIILAKPDRDEKPTSTERQLFIPNESKGSSSSTSIPTTFTIKARDPDSRAVSPSCQKAPSVLRKDECSTPTYQIASKPSAVEVPSNPLQLPNNMHASLKLVDENLQICEAALEHLADQNDFLVVGILGEQGCGKSYVMSALAGRPGIFQSNTQERYESGMFCTTGIDMFITGSRMILLDTQPMFAASFIDVNNSQLDKKLSGEVAPSTTENNGELQSLQMAAFLIAVCHVIIVTQDWFCDTSIIRCLMDAEMLKPITSTTAADDQIVEYFPHIVYLKNRATPSDFTVSMVKEIQEVMTAMFTDSRLHTNSGLNIASGKVIAHLTPESVGGCFNVFLLPENEDHLDRDLFRGHCGFNELVKIFRHQILSAHHQSLTTTPLSERHWFHYASKTLDNIKKSTLFMEFSRFLP